MAIEKKRIMKRYILLCEGIDTVNFFLYYLNSSELADDKRFSNDIQALDFGGINNLSKYILNLKNMEGFDNVNRIMIVRDAETDADAAVKMIKNALLAAELPIPCDCNEWTDNSDELKIAFTLMPSCSTNPVQGAIEDLCWNILRNNISEKMRKDVEDFVLKINNEYNSIGSHMHKSRLHTCFSINKDFISFKIGEAAKAGAFDWKHSALIPLKALLKKGFE